jgi:hypothetical protein
MTGNFEQATVSTTFTFQTVQVVSAVVQGSHDGLSASAEASVRSVLDGLRLDIGDSGGARDLGQTLLGIADHVLAVSEERAVMEQLGATLGSRRRSQAVSATSR